MTGRPSIQARLILCKSKGIRVGCLFCYRSSLKYEVLSEAGG